MKIKELNYKTLGVSEEQFYQIEQEILDEINTYNEEEKKDIIGTYKKKHEGEESK